MLKKPLLLSAEKSMLKGTDDDEVLTLWNKVGAILGLLLALLWKPKMFDQ